MKTKSVTNCGRHAAHELQKMIATAAPGQLPLEFQRRDAGRTYRDRRKAARAGMAKLIAGGHDAD
jgi:hypothetical protein